tara:strand:- start:6308 stop:9133 length:2826 start_codon:yes stop_codon:yes gene_type:complete
MLDKLSRSLQKYGKENLDDIVHFLAAGVKGYLQCDQVRIYLEDLYEGMLICHYVTGLEPDLQNSAPQFIASQKSIISSAFYENRTILSWQPKNELQSQLDPIEKVSGIKSSAIFPIASSLKPIGIMSLNWKRSGEHLSSDQIEKLQIFLTENCPVLENAKEFHQKINFSKHLDLARKKEAVSKMVRSAVNIISKLTLASVLVPSSTKSPQENISPNDMIEALAVYSRNEESIYTYKSHARMSIMNDRNLINRIVKFDQDFGLTATEPLRNAVYIENVKNEKFMCKTIAQKIDLVSLYQIPKYESKTGRFICAVNYYTDEVYRFSAMEKRLLEEHANMVENIILEENPARMEIQVLNEIEELLSDTKSSLTDFLGKILDKTSELLGADSGSISLLKMIDGKPWLLVEDPTGTLIGAKSHGFKKNKIPPLQVGGKELSQDARSLTGHCAQIARPIRIKNARNLDETDGFYKNLSSSIHSELAVPIIFGSSVLGVINQDSFRLNYFTKEHQHILQIVSRLINQKTHNLMQIEDLKKGFRQLSRDIQYRDPKVNSYYFGNVIGKSGQIHSLVTKIDTVVQSICNRMLHWEERIESETLMGLPSLLITGPTGSGKEFFFNNIYARLCEIFEKEKSSKFELPVKKTNIGAYSGELSYSELFGHKKGAFTGAESNRMGILEEADGGVVFLDEIGDTDPKTQVQLLRFLDTGVFVRLGENEPRYSKTFLVAATNKDLLEEIQQRRFREDLYHRLNELSFKIPSLNERDEDIADLAVHFLGKLYRTYKNEHETDSPPLLELEAINFLKNHHYRGNVRELKNILLRAMLFRKSPEINLECILAAVSSNPEIPTTFPHLLGDELVEHILNELETGKGDFWSIVHIPFKKNEMTRETVKNIINEAKKRYHVSLPALAIKLKVCKKGFQAVPGEKQKFISFKNFLYKTVRYTEN